MILTDLTKTSQTSLTIRKDINNVDDDNDEYDDNKDDNNDGKNANDG
jgi:hypothetical protein